MFSGTDTPPAILNALANSVFVVGAHNEIVYLTQSAEQFFQASMGAIIKQEINATETDHIFQLDKTIDS